MLHDMLDDFYFRLNLAYGQALDADMPIDLIYGIVKAFEKQVTVDFERNLLNQANEEFMEEVQPGISELH